MSEAREIPGLSKSRFLAGLQCRKRLYLECFDPELASPIDAVTRSVLDAGHAVGVIARERFPGGVLIDHEHVDHELAVAATREALVNGSVPAIYEAAATGDGVRVRADILVRVPGAAFDLIEMKSTTKVKPQHEWDVTVQLHVFEAAGVCIRRVHVMHLDRSYVYQGGNHDMERLFALENLTDGARTRQVDVRRLLGEMRVALRCGEIPAIAVGPHCEVPYICRFYEHCHDGLPEDPFDALPRLSRRLRERIDTAGIASLDELPLDFHGLSLIQRRALEALRNGSRVIDPAIREALSTARFPVHFVDFETFAPAIPIYPGTHPYDAIPFQWSDHVLHEGGEVEHHEFLYDGDGDPRRMFAERLLQTTSSASSVIVYSPFEDQRLADLQAALPDLRESLGPLRARLVDLLPIIRRHVYDPGFAGSFSIKAVLPVMVPGQGYDDLEISEGSLASIAFGEMVSCDASPERRQKLRANLLAYCKRDTEAMLELFRILR